jgi:DNA-binding YbaB/EbfC family protein
MAKGFKGPALGGQAGMLQQFQRMQQQMVEAQEKLKNEVVTVTAGGGAITITMTGDQQCREVRIEPQLLKEADVEMLQDLVLSAVNGALEKSRELQQKMLGPLAGGLSI